VYNNRGAALDALGRNADAVTSYYKATSVSSSYELAWHNLGNSLYTQEAYKHSAEAYSRAAALKPDRRENWSGLAASWAKLGKAKKAKAAIKHLDPFVSDDDIVLLTQADLFMESGQLVEALEKCEQYARSHPDSALGYAHKGNVEHEMGIFARAMGSFEKALEISPDDKEIWNNLGYTHFVAGYLDKAIECFDKALSIDPKYKHAWYNKGYAYHGADILEEAVKSYLKAIEIDPRDKVLWNNLGNAMYNLGRYAESIPRFVEAIKVDPDYEIAWNNIGNALEKMHLHADAIPYHGRSLEISPDFDYALYAMGVCKAVVGELEEGYDLVLESLDLNPSYDEAWKAKAEIAGQLGRWDEALSAIEEALSINPEYDQGWVTRGEILVAVGDHESSQASFEMALRCLDSIHSDTSGGTFAIMRRGEVLQRIGRFDEALANFESVVVSGRLNHSSVVKVLELRRLLNRWDLFLVEAGELTSAERVLALVPDSLRSDNAYLTVKARLTTARGEDGGVPAEERPLGSGPEASLALLAEAEGSEAKRELEAAQRLYKRALDANPSNISAAAGIARLSLALGSHRQALSQADRAIGIDRRDWEPHRIKAVAYRSVGKDAQAEAETEEAAALARSAGVPVEDFVPRDST